MILLLLSLLALATYSSASTVNKPVAKTWSNRLGATMTPITTGVWSIERPFIWNGIDVGSRSVVCRMDDGSLLVHSPLDATDDIKNCLHSLGGEVKYVISPNYEHLKYATQWAELFPGAVKIGPQGIEEKIPTVNWNQSYNAVTGSGDAVFERSVEAFYFDCEEFLGKPFFGETNYYHKKSKTFFCADSFWNYPRNALPNHYGREGVGEIHLCSKMPLPLTASDLADPEKLLSARLPLGTFFWSLGMDRLYQPFYKRFMVRKGGDRSEGQRRYRSVVQRILSREVEVIAPCHGDVVKGASLCREVLMKHFSLD